MRAIQLQLCAHVLAHDDVTPRMSATIYVNKKCLELSDPFPSPLRLVKGLACETIPSCRLKFADGIVL